MSAAISPATQRPYGVQRVCRVWAVPRSTFYRAAQPAEPGSVRPRGPKPRLKKLPKVPAGNFLRRAR